MEAKTMKKYLCLFAVCICFVLFGCAQQPADSATALQQSATSAADENDSVKTELEKTLQAFATADFIGYGREKTLIAADLAVQITDVSLVDKDYAQFSINISNGTDTLVLPVKAELLYYMHEEMPMGHELQWGCINLADGQLILTKYDFDKNCSVIHHYDAKTLQHINTVEMSDSPDIRLLNTAVYNDGYASLYSWGDIETGLMIVGKDGTIEQRVKYDGGYRYENVNDYNHLYRYFGQDIGVLTDDLVLVGGSDLYSLQRDLDYYGLLSDRCHNVSQMCSYTQGDTAFKLYRSNSSDIKPYFALLYKNGKVTDSFFADGVDIHQGFANTENTDYKPVQYTFANDDRAITIVCDLTQLTLTVDFDSRTIDGQYNITEDRLEREYAKSADGRLSLWSGASAGGGDYWVSAIIAKDNTTGQLKYLGCPSGMYGSGADWGFFKNGDMYIFGRSEFTVFSSDLNVEEPIFTMSDVFPLGLIDEQNIQYRYLFAVRRDPETFGYTVVYTDVPYYAGVKYPELGSYADFSENYNYKVALLDAEGRIYKNIVTDIAVKTTPFGYTNMNMYLQPDGLMHMTTWIKNPENVYDDFTVDITNGKVTDLLKEKYTDEIVKSVQENIDGAHSFIRGLKSGSFVDMERPIDEELNPYSSKPTLYAMQKDYNRLIYLEKAAQKYYLDSFAEYAIYPDLTHYSVDSKTPFLAQINNEIWCNTDLCEDVEQKIFDKSTIKVESIAGSACVIGVQYHTEADAAKQTAYYSLCRSGQDTEPAWVFTSLVI